MPPLDSRNPGVKRLRKEYEEFQHAGETDDIKTTIAVFPLEDNFFEWHFTMSGPEGSDYEGGLYHGKINFPTNYPFAPPDIMFLSPNGRFQLNTKICLTVTGYHPEQWQPAWSSRTILLALRQHMIIDDSAVGALKMTSSERKTIAKESHKHKCEKCGYDAASLIVSINSRIQTAKDNGASIPEGTTIDDSTAESDSDVEAAVVPEQQEEVKNNIGFYWILLAFIGFIVAILIKYYISNIQ